MMDPPPPTPTELAQILADYVHSADRPDVLTQLLRPARLGVRDSPNLKFEYGQHAPFWTSLASVWGAHAGLLSGGDESTVTSLATLGAFLASLCAQCPQNQQNALETIEPSLRKVLFAASSFANLQDPTLLPMTRSCCQAVANMVTANDEVANAYLTERLRLEEEDSLISRLLASQDQGVLQAVLVFLLNAVKGSRERALLLGSSKAGSFILDRVLVLVSLISDDEEEDPAKKEVDSPVFSITYALVSELIVHEAFPATFNQQLKMTEFAVCGAQVTLLKLLDGYLQNPALEGTPPPAGLVSFLIATLTSLSTNLRDLQRPRDSRDAATFQAVVLVLLALCSIGQGSDQGRKEIISAIGETAHLLRYSEELSKPRRGITEIDPDKPDPVDGRSPVDTPAVEQLKRTCVRLCGIAAYDQKDAQDLIRESGALVSVLSMCQINDANPTLREHALFAVRNILKDNETNQALIDGMKPQYLVNPQTGEYSDLPPAMRQEGGRAGL